MKNFTLDLSGQSGVPSQWDITLKQVVHLLGEQIGMLDGVELVSDSRRRGVFNVTAFTREAIDQLSGFTLNMEREGKTFEIRLQEKSLCGISSPSGNSFGVSGIR